MSFFADFVGGAARTLLDERKVALAEKLRQEEEERRAAQRIVATSYDPDRRKIFESLASGETREIDMPEAMQQDLIRKRVMEQRDQLLKDADREKGLAALAKKEKMDAERLKLDRLRTEADIDYKGAIAGEARARSGAIGKQGGGAPAPFKPADVVRLAQALSDDAIPEDVRAAAANAMSVGNYEDAAAILASGKAPTRDPIFIPPPKG